LEYKNNIVIENFQDKRRKPKYPEATFVKVTSPNNEKIDQIKKVLIHCYTVTATSAKMFNDETKQFYQFLRIDEKEDL
jgi:hypothetical protein